MRLTIYGQVMVNVPKLFQDYDDDDPQKDRRNNRWKYWSNVVELKNEFLDETDSTDHRDFLVWLENKYGFKPIETNDGMLTDDYKIVDEQKFVLYVLRYGN